MVDGTGRSGLRAVRPYPIPSAWGMTRRNWRARRIDGCDARWPQRMRRRPQPAPGARVARVARACRVAAPAARLQRVRRRPQPAEPGARTCGGPALLAGWRKPCLTFLPRPAGDLRTAQPLPQLGGGGRGQGAPPW